MPPLDRVTIRVDDLVDALQQLSKPAFIIWVYLHSRAQYHGDGSCSWYASWIGIEHDCNISRATVWKALDELQRRRFIRRNRRDGRGMTGFLLTYEQRTGAPPRDDDPEV